ncbi:MAG: cobalamin-binding protein, partial [Gemmatimonadota bacterium]
MPIARAGRAVIAGSIAAGLACSPEPRTGAGAAADRSRDDDTGRRFEATAPVRRLVSLIPAATEILFAVGAGSQLVART